MTTKKTKPRRKPNAQSIMFNERNTKLFTERELIKTEITKLEETIEKRRSKTPTAVQHRTLTRQLRRLDDITREIVDFNFGLVRSYVKKFTSNTNNEDSADFEAAAVVGLMRAVDTYDPNKGRFGQWAFKPIQREVLRAVRDADHPNMNPGDFEKRPDVLRALADLQGDDEKRPSNKEIAAKAGVTIEQVSRVLQAPHLDSLSAPVGDEEGAELGDLIISDEADLEDTVLAGMSVQALELYGLAALDNRERFVIERRYGLDCEPEQRLSSIGDMLQLSREAVRQIEAKALAKISHPLVLRKLVRNGRD